MRLASFFLLTLVPWLAFSQKKNNDPSVAPVSKSNTSKTAGPTLLSPKDSIFLTVEKGQKIILHPVKPKHTLFSISKFYGLSLEELYEYNPRFQTDPVLRIGETVRIPLPNMAIKRYKTKGFSNAKNVSIYYVVQPGDNLYQISKRYFDMPVDSVTKRNRMKSGSIRPGQRIHMGWMGTEGVPLEWRKQAQPVAHDVLRDRYAQQKVKYKEVRSQGICVWNPDSREKNDLYALHREAAIGTIITVTNPANKKSVYAKVIGRVPPNYNNSVEVVLSPAAAHRLGAAKPELMTRVVFLK